jgi:SAM-dependent methyltransferase
MADRDYVLGTHDDEVERLGIQHRVWRGRALAAWQRAGFRTGQIVLDVGCGPGWATRDLAELVGRSGRVVALDRSRRFLDVVESVRATRGFDHIETVEIDLNGSAVPLVDADGAWCRWVFAFVKEPRALLRAVAEALRPGGALVVHEYFDYGAWNISPRSADMAAFVQTVMRSWRDEGGEPDIALDLVRWMPDAGFEVQAITPIIDVITPASHVWEWPKTFAQVGAQRLVDLGYLTTEASAAFLDTLSTWERSGNSLMTTPGVLEVIARRR